MSELNAEVKKKWLEALRSGEYKQCQAWLRNDYAYCCLGVLCDLHRQETNAEWERLSSSVQRYMGEAVHLPPAVYAWANMSKDMAYDLAAANDNGSTFTQIADKIESEA